jgi:hypothetical protein
MGRLSMETLIAVVLGLGGMIAMFFLGNLTAEIRYKTTTTKIPVNQSCRTPLSIPVNELFAVEGKILEIEADRVYVEFNNQERMWISFFTGYKVFKRVDGEVSDGTISDIQIGKMFRLSGLGLSQATKDFIYASKFVEL